MTIGTKKETCLHLVVLVVALTSCLARRPIVKTVGGDGCNGCRFKLMPGSDVDIYRVIMSDRQACPTPSLATAFDWKVHFSVLYSTKPDGEICIDFGRLKLAGISTNITVNSGRKLSDYMLTSTKYPLIDKSMATVKCYEAEYEVTLMFHSDCDGNLKDYFSSWIYVYYQTSSHPVYHLDGNCRHKYRMASYAQQVTVRSYIWNDVPKFSCEPLPQDCTLKLSTSYGGSNILSRSDTKLCTKWTFQLTACQLSARRKESLYFMDADVSDLKDATIADCQRGFNVSRPATCQPNSLMHDLIIGARSEQEWKILQTGEKEDGALFFEMEATIVEVEDTYEAVLGNIQPEAVLGKTYNDNLFFKILAPVALLIGFWSCVFGVYHKKAKNQQAQLPGAPAQLSIAMQPLMGPGNNAQSHTSFPIVAPNGDASEAGRLELDGIAATAPPPSYTDVTSGGSQPNASPRPPYAVSTELPPPPFSAYPSAPPAAPPAYHDLFPSNT